MSLEDDLFQAEQVYAQIEQFHNEQSQSTPLSSDARLISHLHRIEAEDREIVERTWATLATRMRANESEQPRPSTLKKSENLLLKEPQFMQNPSNTKKTQKTLIRVLELSAAILVIVALVGSMLALLQRNRQNPGIAGSVTATTVVTPRPIVTPVPTLTQGPISCNTPRPATMPALSEPINPALFYMTGSGGYQAVPSATSLIRYDLVTGKQTTLISPTSNEGILDVRLSPDKLWLFLRIVIFNPDTIRLEVMRTDGSMLQTVYESCADSSYQMGASAWSLNGQEVAFPASPTGISILNLTTGKLQTFLSGSTTTTYQPEGWINNQQLLIEQINGTGSSNQIYLLDLSKGANQSTSNLTAITSIPTFCGNLALSADRTHLYTSSCTAVYGNCQGAQVEGPDTVSVLPATGGSAQTVYSSQSHAVTAIVPVNTSSALIYIENTAGDLSQDGLWKINTDGSGLTRLTTITSQPCQYGQYVYPLTQIASDGQYYSVLSMNQGMQQLVTGNLAGGSPTTIVSHQIGANNVLLLAGIGLS